MLSPSDQTLIAAAVTKAEAATSSEIACAVVEEVSSYRETPLAWGAAAALVLPPVAAGLGLSLDALTAPFAGWTAAHGHAGFGPLLTAYVVVQVVLFAVAVILTAIPSVRRALTPRSLKRRRVRRASLQHFAGQRAHVKPGGTLVLVFASLADRQMEIVADDAVDAKVGQAAWDEAVTEALAVIHAQGPGPGLARAVAICGEILARHFPDDGAPDAFPNEAVQI